MFDNLFHIFLGISWKKETNLRCLLPVPSNDEFETSGLLRARSKRNSSDENGENAKMTRKWKMNIEWTWCYSHPFLNQGIRAFRISGFLSRCPKQKHRVPAWNFTKEGRWRSNSWPPRDESHRWRGWEVFLGRACCKLCFKVSTNMHHFQVRSMSPHCRSVGSRELS